jgi:hypothetical protein
VGLYRDDGLAVSSATCRQIEIMKKKICKLFDNNGLKVTIEANAKEVNFLDVTLNLSDGIFKPYMKDNNDSRPPEICSQLRFSCLNLIKSTRLTFASALNQ